MATFIDYTNRLRQWVPAMSPEQSEDFVNQAWRDIREANEEWSFLQATEYWLAPAAIILETLGVTQWSTILSLSVANLTQIGGLINPPITQRQLRFGLSGGPIYGIASTNVQQVSDGAMTASSATLTCATSAPFAAGDVGLLIVVEGAGSGGADLETTIATYVSPTQVTLTVAASTTVSGSDVTWGSTITLDRQYTEATNADQTAQLYRIYYSPLTTDFQRIDHLYDPIMGYEFGWEILGRDDLDRIDPQRSSQTQPYRLFYHSFDQTTGLPVYEMWPGPTAEKAYTVSYWRLGLDFSNDDDALPPQITEELLMTRARMLAYEWAMTAHPDRYTRQSYANALGYIRGRYSTEGQPGRPLGLLDQAKRRDYSIALKEGRLRGRRPGPGWPIDSNFLKSHAFPSGWYGGPY